MARIAVLPDVVASRIAAGEVVERPASALKELIENALDAGARTVEIDLRGGGRDYLAVADDGYGMGPDDLLLALERHATSKIRSDADIEQVRSLGFRGEAVPAIASVSRFRMSSREAADDTATVVEVHGGRVVSVDREVRATGTRVEVSSLFYNAPARRKFLRSADTERQKAIEVVSRFAVGYPEVRFRLDVDGRIVLDHAAVKDPLERCAQVFGRQFTARLLAVRAEIPPLALTGLCSGLDDSRSHSRDQHLFVNRRPVRDRLLSHAVSAAYQEVLPRGRVPVVILLLTLPPEMVDVNVHPSKAEVRFRRPSEIHEFVSGALAQALRDVGGAPGAALVGAVGAAVSPRARTPDPEWVVADPMPDHAAGGTGGGGPAGPAAGGAAQFRAIAPPAEAGRDGLSVEEIRGAQWGRPTREGREGRAWEPEPRVASPRDQVPTGRASDEDDAARRAAPRPLGQFLDSYILAAQADRLLVVDQHAAHERILFERIRGTGERGGARAPSQGLLTPVPVEVARSDAAFLDPALAALTALGFEVERFGSATLLVRALPAALEGADPERLIREALSDLREGPASDAAERARRVAATTACHAAIKVRFPLNTAKMAWILEELGRCETPSTCPHGRPTTLRFTLEELEKAFQRR